MKETKKNQKRIMSFLLTACIMISVLIMPVVPVKAQSVADDAVTLGTNDSSTCYPSISGDKSYKIKVSKAGTLKLSVASKKCALFVYLYDSNGKAIKDITNVSASQGDTSNQGEYCFFKWDQTMESIKGTISYKLSSGTYYLKLSGQNYSDDSNKTTVKTSFTATKAATSVSIQVELSVGSSLTLKSILAPSDSTSSVTWSSSKKSVCTVSSKGKVKAVGKGSCTIYSKANGHSAKLNIKVVN